VQTSATFVHPPQHLQPRRCFAECAIHAVDFSSDRGRMIRHGFKVDRQFGDLGIEGGDPLVISGGGGVRVRGIGLECRDSRYAFRDGAT
jgi:hypothetical protein